MSTRLYLLGHVHVLDGGEEDGKIVGIYSSPERAEAAKARAARLPGFRDHPDGFSIDPYDVDRDYWQEGFETLVPK